MMSGYQLLYLVLAQVLATRFASLPFLDLLENRIIED